MFYNVMKNKLENIFQYFGYAIKNELEINLLMF
jgi:hypothetical protein